MDKKSPYAKGSPSALVTEVVTITPSVAADVLQNWSKNVRKIQRHKVKKLISAMRGKWHLNGETIKFNYMGFLEDGQHRLTACVESGIPFTTLAVFGVESSAGVDEVLSRTAAHLIEGFGVVNAVSATAVARIDHAYRSGRDPWAMWAFPNDIIVRHYGIMDQTLLGRVVSMAKKIHGKKTGNRLVGGNSSTAFVAYLSGVDLAERFEDFMMRIVDGISIEANSAEASLMQWHRSMFERKARSNAEVSRMAFMATGISWINHINDQQIIYRSMVQQIRFGDVGAIGKRIEELDE